MVGSYNPNAQFILIKIDVHVIMKNASRLYFEKEHQILMILQCFQWKNRI